MRTMLLTTGSRALADTEASTRWAKDILREMIGKLEAGDVVVTGDATGPDRWSSGIAVDRKLKLRIFEKSGFVTDERGYVTSRWLLEFSQPVTGGEWRERLLGRDRAMVKMVAAARPAFSVLCIALLASWSRTHGTAYTARHAKEAGIRVETFTCLGVT